MKEFKPLTKSQIELLEMKVKQIQNIMQQAQILQEQNQQRIERMKIELDIPPKEANQWQMSKDGKGFEREKEIKKTFPGKKNKGNKDKK